MKKKKFFPVRTAVFAAAILIAAAGFSGFIVLRDGGEKIISRNAERIVKKCSGDRFRPLCYEKEVPRLLRSLSMKDAFRVLFLIQQKDSSILHCHTLGHKLAELEVEKDTSRWKDVFRECPVFQCNNGCAHGAIMTRYRSDVLKEEELRQLISDLNGICLKIGGKQATEAETAICFHGLGHLFVYVTGADMHRSVGACREITGDGSIGRFMRQCAEGVFMTIYQPIDAEGEVLSRKVAPTVETVNDFCEQFGYSKEGWEACRGESWILFGDKILTPEKTAEFCSYASTSDAKRNCYGVILNKLAIDFILTTERVGDYTGYCEGLDDKWKGFCYEEGAVNLVESDLRQINRAVRLCESSKDKKVEEGCLDVLSSYFPKTFIDSGSKELKEYCNALPDDRKGVCLNEN